MTIEGTTEVWLKAGECLVPASSATSVSARQLNAWHERQAALAAVRERDDEANRERLAMARVTMDQALEDGYDCE